MADPNANRRNIKILACEDCGDCITGILEADDAYQSFTLWPSGKLTIEESYPKARYRDLEQFQGAMGKFEPYTFFLREPVKMPLHALFYREVRNGLSEKPALRRGIAKTI
jgi:hypothetical protein